MSKSSRYSRGINLIEIFGSYNERSIGDTLILIGLISAISSHFGRERVSISVLSLGLTKRLLCTELEKFCLATNVDIQVVELRSSRWRRVASLAVKIGKKIPFLKRVTLRSWPYVAMRLPLTNCDMAIFGGGNLVMDIFPLWPHIAARVVGRWLSHSVPYLVAGVGAGPINTQETKKIFSNILLKSSSNTFRDPQSIRLCEHELLPHDSSLAPDCAFAIGQVDLYPSIFPERACLGINFAGVFGPTWPCKNPDKYNKFLHSVVKAISEFTISNGWEVKIIISNLSDVAASKQLEYELLQAGVLGISWSHYADNRPSDMISACASCKAIVAVRLHACIASALVGTIPIGIVYQPKVRDVLLNSMPTLKTLDLDSVACNPNLLLREISMFDQVSVRDLRSNVEALSRSSRLSLSSEIKKIENAYSQLHCGD